MHRLRLFPWTVGSIADRLGEVKLRWPGSCMFFDEYGGTSLELDPKFTALGAVLWNSQGTGTRCGEEALVGYGVAGVADH